MAKTRPLYILVSQTNTGIGRLIRNVCKFPYNHVSITLDPAMKRWYGFARYVCDAPFYAGLVSESPRRLCGQEGDVLVRAYRVEIPEHTAARLEGLLALANDPQCGLIYNHFDAMASAFGHRILLPRCYTCLSFACEILDQQYDTIPQLCDGLENQLIFEGPMTRLVEVDRQEEDPGLVPGGIVAGACGSVKNFGRLSYRTIQHGCSVYLSHLFRRTVH